MRTNKKGPATIAGLSFDERPETPGRPDPDRDRKRSTADRQLCYVWTVAARL
ncbi:hypothetical protein [Hoeflea sp.]|uniref:hypothetical protein n=1 Tax=Hoeflea sp. TaxID=1940281 RepID=UPI003B023B7C